MRAFWFAPSLRWCAPPLLWLAFSAPALAQDAAVKLPDLSVNLPPPPPRALPKGSLTGHVACADTRLPARGAMVLLFPVPGAKPDTNSNAAPQREAMSRVGLDGTYSLQHVAPGDYVVLAFLPGYLSPMDGLNFQQGKEDPLAELAKKAGPAGVVHLGTGVQTRDITLDRGATVSGSVLYADGSPATQVYLSVENVAAKARGTGEDNDVNMGAMYRTLFTHQSLATDDQGHFRISGIAHGTYRLAVSQPFNMNEQTGPDGAAMRGMMSGLGDPNALRYYAGDTMHAKAAKTYELRGGDQVNGVDIRLPVDGLHPVTVRLLAADGRAINSGEVMLKDTADEGMKYRAQNRLDGNFVVLAVPPGTYTVTAQQLFIGPGYGPPTAAFADVSGSVIVKETDTAELNFTPKEVPLSPPAKDQDQD